MHALVCLLERWPLVRSHNAHHDVFRTHEMLTDVFVTDLDTARSLQDCFADGTVVSAPKRMGWRVELVVLGTTNQVIDAFGDDADSYVVCASREDFRAACGAPFASGNVLRFGVCLDQPLSSAASAPADLMSALKMAANSTVTQNLAVNDALDFVDDLCKSLPPDVFWGALAFGSVRFRNNAWTSAPQTVAIVPAGEIASKAPLNASAVLSMILERCGVDVSDSDFVHNEHATVTLEGSPGAEMWTCTCRAIVDSERYEVCRYFPPMQIGTLPAAFLHLTDPPDWVIRDTIGAVDNLVDQEKWRESAVSSAVLAACLPAVRDLVRRRTVVERVPEILETAEQENLKVAIDTTPDEIVDPPPPAAGDSEEPPAAPHWSDAVLSRVREAYGEEYVGLVAQLLEHLSDSVPYTIVIGSQHHTQVLQGALPPSVIQHLTQTSAVTSLPTDANHATKLYREKNGTVRVGRIKLDIESFLNCERVSIYRGYSKAKKTAAAHYPAGAERRPQRGSVHRFAKKIELARMLMHR